MRFVLHISPCPLAARPPLSGWVTIRRKTFVGSPRFFVGKGVAVGIGPIG